MLEERKIDGLAKLRGSLSGDLLVPSDADFEAARACFNKLIDRRPAVIARCAGAGDVAAALDFAQSHDLEIAVRGGGHNPAGHCVVDGGLVIDLTRMRTVDVYPQSQTAIAAGGATWLDFDTATQTHGLATPGGVVGSTGVAGLALGGGIGHLTAQFGLTCDQLIGVELVTPMGERLRASDDEDPELLWALRGGGGNFGVATALEFRLHPLERVVGGRLDYEGAGAAEVMRAFRNLDARAGNELSCQAQFALCASLEPMVNVFVCYSGPDAEIRDLPELRAAPGLVSDSVRTRTFLEQQTMLNPGYGVDRNYWKGHFVRELPDALIDELVERIGSLGRPPGEILIESLHGASKDIDPTTAALGYRDAAFNVSIMASWLEPERDEEMIAWARETAAAIEPWSVSGGYPNYMQADEPLERVRAAFGDASFERLRRLKTRHDPENVLHRNQNIPPL